MSGKTVDSIAIANHIRDYALCSKFTKAMNIVLELGRRRYHREVMSSTPVRSRRKAVETHIMD